MNKKSKIGSAILLFSLSALFLWPLLSLAQIQAPIKPPEDINQAKNLVEKTGKSVLERLPDAIREVWKTQVLPLWRRMWEWLKKFWDNTAGPYLKNLWYSSVKPEIDKIIIKIKGIVWKKIEEKKPQVQEEFQKKKQETTKEIEQQMPNVTKTLWEKFRQIIK